MVFTPLVFANANNDIESIEIVGKKQSKQQPFSIDKQNYSGFVKSISREDFAYEFVDMANVLDELSGVQVKQTGGYGSASTTSIRGASAKQVNFYLDGMLLNSAYSGLSNLTTLPSVIIQTVDVYPGASPIQLSNPNLAGAVNFSTRHEETESYGGQAALGYGSFDTKQVEWTHWQNIDAWQIISAVSSGSAENDYPIDKGILRANNNRVNDGYKQNSGLIKLLHDGPFLTSEVMVQAYDDHKEIPTQLNQDRDAAFTETTSLRSQVRFAYSLNQWDIKHDLFYSTEDLLYNDKNGSDSSETDFSYVGSNNTITYHIQQHELSLGAELSRSNTDKGSDNGSNQTQLKGDRESLIVSLGDNWFITPEFMLTLQSRYFNIEDQGKFTGIIRPSPESSINNNTWHAGFIWHFNNQLTIKSNISKTLRIPTVYEKFGDSGNYIGNPYLNEETANNLDLGLLSSFKQLFTLEASVFVRELGDGIFDVYNSQGVGGPKNISESRLIGIEADLNIYLTSFLTMHLSGQKLDSENLSSNSGAEGNYLPGIYHQDYLLGFSLNKGNHQFSINYQTKSELYYKTGNAGKADTRKNLDVSYSRNINDVTINFMASNVLDKNYQDFNRMPTPGTAYSAKLTYTY